jgi:enamine deaminase RidA (YjgF/YER057c/UK114 family)
MIRHFNPASIAAPLGRYSHGVEISGGARVLIASGQVGVTPDGSVPEDVAEQARLAFENVAAILAGAGMSMADVVRINTYLGDKSYIAAYREVRLRYMPTPPPASTTLIVAGFAGDAFKLEIEVIAAKV